MQLANVQVARFGEQKLSPLTIQERIKLDNQMREQGGMTVEHTSAEARFR